MGTRSALSVPKTLDEHQSPSFGPPRRERAYKCGRSGLTCVARVASFLFIFTCHTGTMKHSAAITLFLTSTILTTGIDAQSAHELIDSLLNPAPGSEHYSSYSSEIYYNHALYNQTPVASTNNDRLEASAKLILPPAAYDYASGGAGLEKTVKANRDAFDHVSAIWMPCFTHAR